MKAKRLFLTVLLTAPMLALAQKTVFTEDFEGYASAREIIEPAGPWAAVETDGGVLPPILRESGGTQFIELSKEPNGGKARNGLLVQRFKPSISSGTVRLAAKMLHSINGTGQYVGIFNQEMTKGYAIYWTAGEVPTTGNAHVVRFDLVSSVKWTTRGVNLATVKNSEMTHDSQAMPLAQYELIVNLDSGAISLSQDGTEKVTCIDPSPLRDLDTIVIRGNGGGLFDDITVALDE